MGQEGDGGMTLARRTPLRRKRATARRIRSPRCEKRGCKRRADVVLVGGTTRPDGVFVQTLEDFEKPVGALCKSHAKTEADRIFSLLVRSVGKCERCGKTEGLQCSHFISRRYLGTRWVRLNAECLCLGCHKFLTERPLEARDRARTLLGEVVYGELEEQARRFVGPTDYAVVLRDLRGQIAP